MAENIGAKVHSKLGYGHATNAYPLDIGAIDTLIISIYILLKPIYIWKSGIPQPSELFIAACIPWIVYRIGHFDDVFKYGVMFAGWVAFVNFLLASYYMAPYPLLSTIYIIFDVFICVYVFTCVVDSDRSRAFLRIVVLMALLAELVLVRRGGGFRATGTFNDPNQLAYWNLLLCGIYFVLRRDLSRLSYLDGVAVAAAVIIGLSSLSRSGLVGLGAILFVVFAPWCFARMRNMFLSVVSLCVFVIGFNEWIIRYISRMSLVESLQARIYDYSDSNSLQYQFAIRGYNRILENPEYLLFGAGEGLNQRFSDGPVALEIHSTLLTILFSYGVIGLLFFGMFILVIYKKSEGLRFAYLLGPFVYGWFQNGLRFSMFWVLLAAIVGSSFRPKEARRLGGVMPDSRGRIAELYRAAS